MSTEAFRKQLLKELKACSSSRNLKRGKEIHARAIKSGIDLCNYIAATLVDMYAKCGSMVLARRVFDNTKNPDVVLWNALIMGYAQNGDGTLALDMFSEMKSQGCAPSSITLIAALKACTSLAVARRSSDCLNWGKQIHSQIGSHSEMNLHNTLIDMYAKCGSMLEARKVFDGMKKPNVVSWNALLSGYAEQGEGATALDLFTVMKNQGCLPDCITFLAVLKACTSLIAGTGRAECLHRVRELHSQIGRHLDSYVQSTLIDVYAKCGSMVDARQVFDSMKTPSVVAWNALILGYADNGEGSTALDMFSRMRSERYSPDSVTFVAALKACSALAMESRRAECKEWGKQIHSNIGSHLNVHVQNSLIDMYAKCGSVADARHVFDSIQQPDVVSWTSLISGYATNGEGITALDVFGRMQSQGCAPNSVTFVAAVKACTSLALEQNETGRVDCLEIGKEVHSQIGNSPDMFVQSTLIDMYAKCGCMVQARQVFDTMKNPDVVSWNALITGYVHNGEATTALHMFTGMRSQGCSPNTITFAAALKACGLLGAFESGCKIHAEVGPGTEPDGIIVTSLVDFYGKCGNTVEAQKVFDLQLRRDLITWNALLAGYSRLGDSQAAFGLFRRLLDAGLKPDSVTFLCILSCCSHAGLVEKAFVCFEAMPARYGLHPGIEHYTCMVDIFGRSNKLDDAMALLHSMPSSPNTVAWLTALGACVKWKNAGIGRLAFMSLVSLDDRNTAAYVLMAHIYGERGMWDEQKMVLGMKTKLKTEKTLQQACWTSDNGEVHTFSPGGSKHPQDEEIQKRLKLLGCDVHQDEGLCGHAEMLALACALINTKPGKTVRLVKNVKVCNDCHSAIAAISKLEQRTIICRDANRFHVFKNGDCGCSDFR